MKYSYDCQEFKMEVFSESEMRKEKAGNPILLYVMQGRVDCLVDNIHYYLAEENILMINRESTYLISPDGDSFLCMITISAQTLKPYIEWENTKFLGTPVDSNEKNHSELSGILKKLLDIFVTITKGKPDAKMTGIFYMLIYYLLKNYLDKEKIPVATKQEERKAKVEGYIEQNYRKPITLQQLADEVYLTYYYLSHNFKQMFGMGFQQYLNTVRLRHVVEELIYTDKAITEIAIDNGFTSASVLNRVFQAKYKATPSAYKKQVQKKRNQVEEPEQKLLLEKMEEELCTNEPMEPPMKSRHQITTDVKIEKRLKKVFNRMINIGFSVDLLSSSLQEHMIILHRELGYTYMRVWNVFHEQIEFRHGHEIKNFNFEKLDRIFDFMVENRLKPFIEFGDKPKLITENPSNDRIREMESIGKREFNSKEEFKLVLSSFIDHIIERYGVDEVTTWQYEFWNDFYRPGRQKGSEQVGFFEAFDIGYAIIKERIPDCMVGGSGMPFSEDVKDFLKKWKTYQNPDFISILLFPYSWEKGRDGYETYYMPEENGVANTIQKMHSYIEEAGLDAMLYIDEWNSSVSNSRNYQNDSCFQAAYCVKNAIDIIDQVDLVGYWAGSDYFASFYDPYKPINGSSGLISRSGIRKPAFYAFQFLNSLDSFLVYKDANAMITTDKRGGYSILCHNYRHMDYQYHMDEKTQQSVESHILKAGTNGIHVGFQLAGIKEGRYQLSIWKMGPGKGSVLEEWHKLGMEFELRKEIMEYLKNTCSPQLTLKKAIVREDGILTFEIELDQQEIALVKLNFISEVVID